MPRWLSMGVCSMGLAMFLSLLAGDAAAATKTVQVGPNGSLVFSPVMVTVNMGDTVEWVWGSGPHSTTRTAGPDTWDSGVTGAPHMFSHTFTRAGTFPYVCSVHQQLGMVGTVVVRRPTPSTTTTTMAGTTSTTMAGQLPPPCTSVDACRLALMAALPTPASATNARARRVTRHLVRLDRRIEKLLDRSAAAGGQRRVHDFTKAGRVLAQLGTAAGKADAGGTLSVPLGPIDAAIQSLVALLPTS